MSLYLYGAGKTGEKVFNKLIKEGIDILGFIDTFSKYSTFCGYSVLKITDDIDINKEVLLCSLDFESRKMMREVLIKRGFKESNIYDYDSKFKFIRFTEDELKRLEKISKKLINGKETFNSIIEAREKDDLSLIKRSKKMNKSSEYKLGLDLSDNEVIIDGGTYDGSNAYEFLTLSQNPNVKVYSFDPFGKRFVKKEFLKNKKISFVENGLWLKNETLHFRELENDESAGSYIDNNESNDGASINGISIDSYFKLNIKSKISFIKMDIEGSEVNALKGAKNVIEKFKPDMAICLYHKDSDFYRIPELVLDFVPFYKMWFGHHSNTFEDSIMYFSTKSPLNSSL